MTRVAAIDMGTHSTRLLIADVEGEQLVAHARRMRITRLGEGVDASRLLRPEAIDRVVDVVGDYANEIQDAGVERVRAVATSAARDASNATLLFDRCESLLGVRPDLIEGGEEAALSFLGATAGITVPEPVLVVDIGGGSTEFVVGTDTPEQASSINIGCVRLTEQFLASDPPTPEELSQCVTVVRDYLADVARVVPAAANAKTLIGLAGTVSTMAAIEQGLARYDRDRLHHFRLTRAAAEEIFRTLATETTAERCHNPGLDPGRAEVIVGGVIVAVCVMRHWQFDEMLVSESDILDGIARRLADNP